MVSERSSGMLRCLASFGVALFLCADVSADYGEDRKVGLALSREKRFEEALTFFLELGRRAKNDIQRSDTFEQAAMSAQRLGRNEEALALAARIPAAPHAKAVRMRLLAGRERWEELLGEFRDEDMSSWPRSAAREACHLRGKAHLAAKDRESALRDLTEAARGSEDMNVYFALAGLCASLGRDVEALDAYRNFQRAHPRPPAGWTYLTSVTARAGLLLRNGKPAYALEELDKATDLAPSGYWRVQVLKLRAAALKDLGRIDDAAATYRRALEVDGIYSVQRNAIESALKELHEK